MKFIQMELIAGWGLRDVVQGGTAWHKDVGSSSSRERGAEREFEGLWGAGKGTSIFCEGREPNYAKLCFRREGTRLRTILLATNNLKIKLRTAQWEKGFRALVGGRFPFDINFTLMTVN